MLTRLLCLCALLLLLLLISPSVRAALITYYRPDSLCLLSEAVVLCEEQSVSARTIQHKDWPAKRQAWAACAPEKEAADGQDAGGQTQEALDELDRHVPAAS